MKALLAAARRRAWAQEGALAFLLLGAGCRGEDAAPQTPARPAPGVQRVLRRDTPPDLAPADAAASTSAADAAARASGLARDGGAEAAERCPGQYEVLFCQGTGYDRCGVEARQAASRGRPAPPCENERRCTHRCQARPPRSSPGGNWCRRVRERLYRCDALVPAAPPNGGTP